MLTDPGDVANKPNPIETVKIEWNWDFNVLAPLHLGGERHDRKASPASPAPGRDVRVVSGASQGLARTMSRLSTSVGVADQGLHEPQAARVHT